MAGVRVLRSVELRIDALKLVVHDVRSLGRLGKKVEGCGRDAMNLGELLRHLQRELGAPVREARVFDDAPSNRDPFDAILQKERAAEDLGIFTEPPRSWDRDIRLARRDDDAILLCPVEGLSVDAPAEVPPEDQRKDAWRGILRRPPRRPRTFRARLLPPAAKTTGRVPCLQSASWNPSRRDACSPGIAIAAPGLASPGVWVGALVKVRDA